MQGHVVEAADAVDSQQVLQQHDIRPPVQGDKPKQPEGFGGEASVHIHSFNLPSLACPHHIEVHKRHFPASLRNVQAGKARDD